MKKFQQFFLEAANGHQNTKGPVKNWIEKMWNRNPRQAPSKIHEKVDL